MTYTLVVSSQGQVVIPKNVRKHLGIQSGSRIVIRAGSQGKVPVAMIEPVGNWPKRVAGIAQGVYGKGEEFVEKEREQWKK